MYIRSDTKLKNINIEKIKLEREEKKENTEETTATIIMYHRYLANLISKCNY